MAVIDVSGIFSEQVDEKFIRDPADPSAPPVRVERGTSKVLHIYCDCPSLDRVIVNGVKYLPERLA